MENSITVKVVADSICPMRHRLTTFYMTIPLYIMLELYNFRMLNITGSGAFATSEHQVAVIVSATEWENFFDLSCPQYIMEEHDDYGDLITQQTFRSRKDIITEHPNWYITKDGNKRRGKWPKDMTEADWLSFNQKQSEIHTMTLAETLWDAYQESIPNELKTGEWHIPFGSHIDLSCLNESAGAPNSGCTANYNLDENKIMIATARCFSPFCTTYEVAIELHNSLLMHKQLNPFEHCARVMDEKEYEYLTSTEYNVKTDVARTLYGVSDNYRGFISYRKIVENI